MPQHVPYSAFVLASSSPAEVNRYFCELPLFLEALQAYASDIQGYYDNTNQNIKCKYRLMEGFFRYIAWSKNL